MAEPAAGLAGLRALVTGGAQGIGAAITAALVDAGVSTVISGRNAEQLNAFAGGMPAGATVRTLVADLADTDQLEQLAVDAWASFDGLDILVNNAGVSFPEHVGNMTTQAWDTTMAVNARAPAVLGARIGTRMAESGRGGAIVNVGSAAGLTALEEHLAYCASKAALVMASQVLALELGARGVRVNVVCPTVVMTEMGQRVWSDPVKAAPLLSRVPAGHFAQPADVASAVLYFAGPSAAMINGVALPVDGGYSAA